MHSKINTIDLYERIAHLGNGQYGEVYSAKHRKTGQKFALKKIKMEGQREGFPITSIREVNILLKLEHDNIVRLHEVVISDLKQFEKRGNVYLVFECMDYDLEQLLKSKHVNLFTTAQIKCYTQQIMNGLVFIHNNGIVHRDMKPSNILMKCNGQLKLGDFGLSKVKNRKRKMTPQLVTLWYRSPEITLGSREYDMKIDVWAAGCIFAELLLHKPLFCVENEAQLMQRIWHTCGSPLDGANNWAEAQRLPYYGRMQPRQIVLRRCLKQTITRHKNYSGLCTKDALELLDVLLAMNPANRPSASDALNCDYFWSKPVALKLENMPKYRL